MLQGPGLDSSLASHVSYEEIWELAWSFCEGVMCYDVLWWSWSGLVEICLVCSSLCRYGPSTPIRCNRSYLHIAFYFIRSVHIDELFEFSYSNPGK